MLKYLGCLHESLSDALTEGCYRAKEEPMARSATPEAGLSRNLLLLSLSYHSDHRDLPDLWSTQS